MGTFSRFRDWLLLKHVVAGLPEAEARAARTAGIIQLTLTTLIFLLLPLVGITEPPDTLPFSYTFFVQLLSFLLVGRFLLLRRRPIAAAVVTILGIYIHIAALCIAFPDDPAHHGFLILALLPFIAIPHNRSVLRWSLALLSALMFFADQYYYRVLGGPGIYGAPRWVVAADYLLPPMAMLTVFYFLLINSFVKAVTLAETRLAAEHAKSEALLINILPQEIAEELKLRGSSEPRYFQSTTVCFTDFQGFTQIAEALAPKELVDELDRCFSYFDSLMDRHNLEKLKTIGDSYMFVGGIPTANRTHAVDCVLAALEIQGFMNQMKAIKQDQRLPYWELRLGIHSGDLVAGVIGEKKFAYDVWSDTVNTASRCEAAGVAGRINISAATHELVRGFFDCEYRGAVPAKHKGEIDMYFVNGLRPDLCRGDEARIPNAEFQRRYAALQQPIAGAFGG